MRKKRVKIALNYIKRILTAVITVDMPSNSKKHGLEVALKLYLKYITKLIITIVIYPIIE